jgi:hypothetical protein
MYPTPVLLLYSIRFENLGTFSYHNSRGMVSASAKFKFVIDSDMLHFPDNATNSLQISSAYANAFSKYPVLTHP